MSFVTEIKAVSVLWCDLYADCFGSCRLFSNKCFLKRDATIFSVIFKINERFETGR